MEQSLFGLRGIITDSITGIPLKAKIEILGHDIDSSHIYSNLPIGNYHRHIAQGNYNFTFSKNGYYSKTINATILNNNTLIQDIQLVPYSTTEISEIKETNEEKHSFDILGRPAKRKGYKISNKNKKLIIE